MLLAQISDLHIKPRGRLAYRTVDTAACLEQAVKSLLALDPAPDAVIATGDLVDAGLSEEYGLLREILSPLRLPLFLMPGNHDLRAPLRAAFPGMRYLGTDGPIAFTVEDFPLRIIALDSLVEGQPAGELGPGQLAWLEQRLAEQTQRGTIVAVHHPPFATGIGHMDKIGLRDAAAFAAVISRHPRVGRVISGHVHRSVQTRFAGTLASIAPSVAHQVALDLHPDAPSAFCLEPAGYHLHYQTSGGGLVTHTATIGGNSAPHPFFENGVLID
jgi:3',5'-cyclic AMP phosphodiesterase CpdA